MGTQGGTTPRREGHHGPVVVLAEDRPVVRAGLRAVLATAEEIRYVAEVPRDALVEALSEHAPDVLVVAFPERDPEPFRVVATAKALREGLRVLVVADGATVSDLREAVTAGVDSFLLASAPESELARAVVATARGQRVLSPEVAMQLAGSWRPELGERRGSPVTPRELEVLQLLAEGLTNRQIARRLGVSDRTVKTHVQHLLAKLDVPDRTGAVARAFRLSLIR